MNDLTESQNNNIFQDSEKQYLFFTLGDSKYALSISQVVEIMKLPMLEYPQKLANNIVGLLNYNNFTINILDLRFYLGINVTPYSVANQLIIVKTDESIFGLIIDKIGDIISIEQSQTEYFPVVSEEKVIDFLYKQESETISVINLNAIENIIKQGCASIDVNIPALFPHDDDSKYKMTQRNRALLEKFESNLVTNIFSQDKFSTFSLGQNIYCSNLEYVKEFLKNSPITKIPCNLDYIAGIITLRGDFVSIIDLKKFLNFGDIGANVDYEGNKNNIIVVEAFDYTIGLLVDEILNIMEIPEALINENPHNPNKYVLSEVVIEDKFYTILNMKDIFSDERLFIEEKM